MKKIYLNKKIKSRFYTVLGSIFLFVCIFGIQYWHDIEQNAWRDWKLQGFYIIDKMEEKRVAGWSTDSITAYGDSLEIVLGRKIPSKCPYCFIQSLIK